MQERTRWRVRTVHHDVAVHARTPSELYIPQSVSGTRLSECSSWPSRNWTGVRTIVAFFAQEGSTRFKQWRNIGAMRCVAVGAVFVHRLMFPQEWAAFFCMTGETRLVNRILLQQFWGCRAMWIVAIGTDHLSFLNRMVRVFIDISTLLLVAGKADFGLSPFVAHIVVGRVNFVT